MKATWRLRVFTSVRQFRSSNPLHGFRVTHTSSRSLLRHYQACRCFDCAGLGSIEFWKRRRSSIANPALASRRRFPIHPVAAVSDTAKTDHAAFNETWNTHPFQMV